MRGCTEHYFLNFAGKAVRPRGSACQLSFIINSSCPTQRKEVCRADGVLHRLLLALCFLAVEGSRIQSFLLLKILEIPRTIAAEEVDSNLPSRPMVQ